MNNTNILPDAGKTSSDAQKLPRVVCWFSCGAASAIAFGLDHNDGWPWVSGDDCCGEYLATEESSDQLRDALEGYRAAAAFISADSWDGCSDCIDVLRAARAADYTNEPTADNTAYHLARIRKHYSPTLEDKAR